MAVQCEALAMRDSVPMLKISDGSCNNDICLASKWTTSMHALRSIDLVATCNDSTLACVKCMDERTLVGS